MPLVNFGDYGFVQFPDDMPEDQLRAAARSAYDKLAAEHTPAAPVAAPTPTPAPDRDFSPLAELAKGFGQNLIAGNAANYGAGFETAANAFGLDTFTKAGDALKRWGQEGRADDEAPRADSLRDVFDDEGLTQNLSDLGNWLSYAIGQGVASMAPTLGAAVAGGAVGGPVGAAGAGLASAYLSITGDIKNTVAQELGDRYDPATMDKVVALAGVPGAALEYIGATKVLGAGLKEQMAKSLGHAIAQAAKKGGSEEALTEAAQSALAEVTADYLGDTPFSADSLWQIAEGAIAGFGTGAVGAGGIQAATGVRGSRGGVDSLLESSQPLDDPGLTAFAGMAVRDKASGAVLGEIKEARAINGSPYFILNDGQQIVRPDQVTILTSKLTPEEKAEAAQAEIPLPDELSATLQAAERFAAENPDQKKRGRKPKPKVETPPTPPHSDPEASPDETLASIRGLYSTVGKALETTKLTKGTGKQWLAELTKQGAKPAELKATGLDQMASDDSVIPVETIRHAFATNQIDLEEVVAEDSAESSDDRREARRAELDQELAILRNALDEADAMGEREQVRDLQAQIAAVHDEYADLDADLTLGDIFGEGPTRFKPYTLDGGDNYREFKIRLPGNSFVKESHFPEKGIIFHTRTTDRVTPDGKKVLFVEEFQSDQATALRQEARETGEKRAVPFASDGRWEALAVKRMLQFAAENGYDALGWTTGEQQDQRWGLSRKVQTVAVGSTRSASDLDGLPDGTYLVQGYNRAGGFEFEQPMTEPQLSALVGPERARDLITRFNTNREQDRTPLAEVELDQPVRHGGDWAYALYDDRLPKFLRQYAKRFNAAPTQGSVRLDSGDLDQDLENQGPSDALVHYFEIPDAMRDEFVAQGQPLFALTKKAQADRAGIERTVREIVRSVAPTATLKTSRVLYTPLGGEEVGGYQANNTIAVALDNGWSDPTDTAYHEAFHYLERNGFLTPDERAVLDRELPRLREIAERELRAYEGLDPDAPLPKEYQDWLKNPYEPKAVVAAAHARARANNTTLPGLSTAAQTVFDKIEAFFRRLANALRGRGFQTSEDIFDRFFDGEIGRRRPDWSDPHAQLESEVAATLTGSSPGAFRRWFGDSVVVDETGAPRLMFHGSRSNSIEAFDLGRDSGANLYGPGIYLTSSGAVASTYAGNSDELADVSADRLDTLAELEEARAELARMKRDGTAFETVEMQEEYIVALTEEAKMLEQSAPVQPTVYPLYARIEDPFVATKPLTRQDRETLKKIMDDLHFPGVNDRQVRGSKELLDRAESVHDAMKRFYDDLDSEASDGLIGMAVARFARLRGHDGLYYPGGDLIGGEGPHDVFVAFEPAQVKSPFARQPTNDDRLLFSRLGRWGAARAATRRQPQHAGGLLNFAGDISWPHRMMVSMRQLATRFPAFAQVYLPAEHISADRQTILDSFAKMIAPYAALANKTRVHAALELARLNGWKLQPNSQGTIAVANLQSATAQLSKPGDVIRLSPEETQAYLATQQGSAYLLQANRDNLIAGAAPIRFSFLPNLSFSLSPALDTAQLTGIAQALEQAAQRTLRTNKKVSDEFAAEAARVKALAGVSRDTDNFLRHDYVPFSRRPGNYALVVKDGQGQTVWFEIFRKEGQARQAAVELGRRFPSHTVSGFTPTHDALRKNLGQRVADSLISFDTMSRLQTGIDRQTYDRIRQNVTEQIRLAGFPSHLMQADNVPGYDLDFQTSWHHYALGAANHAARTRWDRPMMDAATALPPNTHLGIAARKLVDYVHSGGEEYNFQKGLVFGTFLGFNLSSALLQPLSLFTTFAPRMRAYGNPKTLRQLAPSILALFRRVSTLASGNRASIHDFVDVTKLGLSAQGQIDIERAYNEGTIKPQLTIEQVGLHANRPGFVGKTQARIERVIQMSAIPFSDMETYSRLVGWAAAYRMAEQDPQVLPRAAQVHAQDALWNEIHATQAPTPFSFATYVTQETFAEFGPHNRPEMMRGWLQVVVPFMTYIQQMAELQYRTLVRQGPQGKKAGALMLAALVLWSGVWGLWGADDLRDVLEAITGQDYKTLARETLDAEFNEFLRDTVGVNGDYAPALAAFLTNLATRGLPAAVGIDAGERIGFGTNPLFETVRQVASGDGDASIMAGAPTALLVQTLKNIGQRVEGGATPGEAALREVPVTALRNLIESLYWLDEGVRSKRGNLLIAPENVGVDDVLKKAIGFNPTKVGVTRELDYAAQRVERGAADKQKALFNRLQRIQEDMLTGFSTGDKAEVDRAMDRTRQILQQISEYNAGQPPENWVIINMNSVLRAAFANLNPLARLREVPKKALGRVQDIEALNPYRTLE